MADINAITRYLVLSDGETFEPLAGSKIVSIPDSLQGDERDSAVKARCRFDDDEDGEGVEVLYTFIGQEPYLNPGEINLAPLSLTLLAELAEEARCELDRRAEALLGVLVGEADPVNGRVVRVFRAGEIGAPRDGVPTIAGVTIDHPESSEPAGKSVIASLLDLERLADSRQTAADEDPVREDACPRAAVRSGPRVTISFTETGEQHTVDLASTLGLISRAPTPAGEVIGERRTFVLRFLGRRGALADQESEVEDLLHRANCEDLILHVGESFLEPLDGPALARFAVAAGSHASFFALTDDGADLDPDDL